MSARSSRSLKRLPAPPEEDDDEPSEDRTENWDSGAVAEEIFILCRSNDRVKKDEAIVRRFE